MTDTGPNGYPQRLPDPTTPPPSPEELAAAVNGLARLLAHHVMSAETAVRAASGSPDLQQAFDAMCARWVAWRTNWVSPHFKSSPRFDFTPTLDNLSVAHTANEADGGEVTELVFFQPSRYHEDADSYVNIPMAYAADPDAYEARHQKLGALVDMREIRAERERHKAEIQAQADQAALAQAAELLAAAGYEIRKPTP